MCPPPSLAPEESVALGVARPASESVAPRLRLRCSGRAAMAYTFKDDGGRMTYYREYNKEVLDKNDTLVGNWVEERALRDQIGTGRYALWVNTGDEKSVATKKQQTFTKFTTRPDALDTFSRTLMHSDHTPSAEYATNNDFSDPGYARYINPGVGAREKLMVERAAALARSEEDSSIGELPSSNRWSQSTRVRVS